MKDARRFLYLLTGFVLGLVLGGVYSLRIQPVRYTDISPEMLDAPSRDHYRAWVAAAYAANNDLVRARARLALLNDDDPYRALAEQAQRWLAAGQSEEDARALGLLAASLLQAQATLLAPPAVTSSAVTPQTTEEIIPTDTPPPTQSTLPISDTAQPTQAQAVTPTSPAPFTLSKRETVCDPDLGQGLIQVYVWDSSGAEVAGVEIVINWQGGEDHFFTGLKPDVGLGYADFSMTPGITYTLRIASGGEPVTNLSAPPCTTNSGESYWGVWVLEFTQP